MPRRTWSTMEVSGSFSLWLLRFGDMIWQVVYPNPCNNEPCIMRLLLFRFLFPLLLTRLWSFHGSSNPIRKDQHFPALTHLITIWEYVLYLLPENHYGFPQFHVAIIFCFFNPSMTVDQLVLFKNDLKCFYLAFVLHIYFDLLLWNERSLSNTVSTWLVIFLCRMPVCGGR